MSKIYLSGPMTGLPDLNFPAFNAESARLRGLGFDVVNPAELNPDGASWGECMRKDIVALMGCGIVATLPGWEHSKGARLEVLIGERLEMAVVKAQDLVHPPAILSAGKADVQPVTFQARVQPWLMECFGPMIAGDREERNHRFLEEALELVQACGATANEVHQLVDYVYGRPVGEPEQEVGGVMVTLAALCLANDLDMHQSAETELARIWTKIEQIRAKQAAKPSMSPLPGVYHDRAPVQSDQEPVKSALDHAGFLADAADQVLVNYQAYSLAQMAESEGGDDGDQEREDAINSARDDLHEGLSRLRGAVNDLRRRANSAAAHLGAAPVRAMKLPEHRGSDLKSPVYGFARGWNTALDAVSQLNAQPTRPQEQHEEQVGKNQGLPDGLSWDQAPANAVALIGGKIDDLHPERKLFVWVPELDQQTMGVLAVSFDHRPAGSPQGAALDSPNSQWVVLAKRPDGQLKTQAASTHQQ